MSKIEQNRFKPSQKNIIVAIILLIIVIVFILVAVFSKDKSKKVASKNVENTELQEILLNEEIIEYIDISELEQNPIAEENNTENEETKKENKVNNSNNKNNTNGTPYYIKINYGAQVVTIYKKDAEGNYTIPVKAMICSTGIATPKSGVYKIQYRWKWLGLQGDVYGQYATQIVGNILFHSVPYLERGNPASLEYWEYDKLGTYASAGCIRLKVSDAIWIFNNCASGTQVEFYSSANPGPLGKPSAQKISNAEGNLKNWDPTDPDPNNPWKNYKPEEEKNTNTNVNTDKNNNKVSNNEIANDNTNTQVNETNNDQVSEDTINNEIVNEINTNTTQSNEIVNEITNKENTNSIKENGESKDNKVNEEVEIKEETLNEVA